MEHFWIVWIVTSLWVLFDAKTIGVRKGVIKGFGNMGPWEWFFCSLLFWIFALPFYLSKRGEFRTAAKHSITPQEDDIPYKKSRVPVLLSIFVGLLLFAVGFPVLFMHFHKTSAITSRSRLRSDKELFREFYGDFFQKTSSIDISYRPFADALKNIDLDKAAEIAQRIYPSLENEWSAIDSMSVPDLMDDEIEKSLKEGKDILVYAYLNKVRVVDKFMDYIENPETIITVTDEMKVHSDEYQSKMIMGMAVLIGASQKLGVDLKELKAITPRE